jgi:hypothetical protein
MSVLLNALSILHNFCLQLSFSVAWRDGIVVCAAYTLQEAVAEARAVARKCASRTRCTAAAPIGNLPSDRGHARRNSDGSLTNDLPGASPATFLL